jgi:glycerol dehydrogenase-like iron-containing ADH family enzyme
VFAIKSPQTYHHQPGLLSRTGELLAVHSSDIAIITSPKAWRAVNPQLETSLKAAGIRWQVNFSPRNAPMRLSKTSGQRAGTKRHAGAGHWRWAGA